MEKEKYVFPEKWCIRQNAHQDVCDWFNNKFDASAILDGHYKYLINGDSDQHFFGDYVPPYYEEITLEQFRLYVLGDPQYALDLKEAVREDLSYLANMFQELNIS